MGVRHLKLSFRRKPGVASAVKVYVSVRLWHERGPKQLHLGYLRASSCISRYARRRLAKRLREKWRQRFGSGAVAVDWVGTEKKWPKPGQPQKASVDREAAREQLRCWQSGTDEVILPQFGGPGRQQSELAGGQFHELFMKSHQDLVKRLHGASADPAVVANWWEEYEAPRLLCSYHRLVARRPSLRFSRTGFLRYLAGNISRGFAAAQFLREHIQPAIDPVMLENEWY